MNRVFDVFLVEDVLRELREHKILNVVKLFTDVAEPGKISSRYGYKGDKWYIPEQGKYSDHRESVIVFPDNGARMLVGNIGRDVIAPCKYSDCEGQNVIASKMPKWAARTWVEILDVYYPKRIQELSEADYKAMGFHIEEHGVVSIGLSRYLDAPDSKNVFRWWWNMNMGGWRTIKKGGIAAEVHSYPYDETDELMEHLSHLPKKVFANPYVITYKIKVL